MCVDLISGPWRHAFFLMPDFLLMSKFELFVDLQNKANNKCFLIPTSPLTNSHGSGLESFSREPSLPKPVCQFHDCWTGFALE